MILSLPLTVFLPLIIVSVLTVFLFSLLGVVARTKRSIISFEDPIEFHADHPFIFLLINKQKVPLFLGSVQQINAATAGNDHDEL